MMCPFCVETDLKSVVFIGQTSTTLMGFSPYYDEEGVYHSHDPNCHITEYRCSNGHLWSESVSIACPSCGKRW